MCGISGILSVNDIREENAVRFERVARKFISKRGPDNFSSVKKSQRAHLVHARLSLNDLDERSNQPFFSSCGGYGLVFNGEIYNFRQLRRELVKEGFVFKSSGDTEVLLAALIQFGVEETLNNKIDGMYAFCFVDFKKNKGVIARDRFGEKPLYYRYDGGAFFFSSNQMHLAEFFYRSDVNYEALTSFIRYGFIPPFCELFNGISQLSPGEILSFDLVSGHLEKSALVDANEGHSLIDLDTLKVRFTDALTSSVDQCLRADVPVGVYLSSGLDSSVIALTARKQLGYDIETFTVGFNEHKDESSAVTEFCRRQNIRNSICNVSSESFWEMFLKYPDVYDSPMADTSCALISLLSKQASTYLRCVMGGDGADELFCGYPRYSRLAALKRINKVTRFGNVFSHLARGNKIWKSMAASDSELYARFMDVTNGEFWWADDRLFDPQGRSVLDLDIRNYMPQNCLIKIDRATMHFGIEARSPFLSKEFYKLAANSELEQLDVDFKRKPLQRYVYTQLSGQEYPGSQKFGFSAPYREWMTSSFHKQISEVVSGGSQAQSGALDKRVEVFRSDPKKLDSNDLTVVWRYFCFTLFCRHHDLQLTSELST